MNGATRRAVGIVFAALLAIGLRGACQDNGTALQVAFGANGLQTLSYNGTVLEDTNASPGDGFYIGHMKATDLQGTLLTNGQYGWGENKNSRSWDGNSHTWTYQYTWGSIALQYVQQGNNLNLVVTTTNAPGSGVIFDGASIFPLTLHFPQLPQGFQDRSYPQLAFNTTGPSVTVADFTVGEVAAVVPDATKPLYSGFVPAQGTGVPYAAMLSSTSPDSLPTFQPHNDRPLKPGESDQYTVALRFAPSGSSTSSFATDAYRSWAQTYPPVLNWPDRRPIGTVYLATSPNGPDPSQPGGFPTNPRRYFNSAGIDVTTPSGLTAFQQRVLAQATSVVTNLQQLGGQGAITWDIEGEQFPQSTSYVCEPDQIATIAPEMESVIADPASPYNGSKLDDAYFQIIRQAGFRVGVCLRPQHFTLNGNGTAQQVYLSTDAIASELIRKARYAHDRWGATLFYVDSTVDASGGILPASLFQQVQAALPDSLLIPEETTPLHYAYTAPFKTFLFHGDTGTDASVRQYYPRAFSAVLVNDADPALLAAAQGKLTAQVQAGDVLMAHVDYWQANNPTIAAIYKAAAVSTSGPLVSAPPSGESSGAAPSGGNATTSSDASSAPAAQDGTGAVATIDQTAASNSGSSVPGTTDSGTASTSAASSLPTADASTGTDTTGSASGQGTQSSNGSQSGAAVSGPVQAASPASLATVATTPDKIAIVTPVAGQSLNGSVTVEGVINDALDSAGSHLIVDGFDLMTTRLTNGPFGYALDTKTLPNGAHTLQLWGHDIGNNTILSAIVSVVVNNN